MVSMKVFGVHFYFFLFLKLRTLTEIESITRSGCRPQIFNEMVIGDWSVRSAEGSKGSENPNSVKGWGVGRCETVK